jgi:hypothetical protein
MPQFDLMREPRGDVLSKLLDVAIEACDRFTVERSDMVMSPRGAEVYRRLQPFLLSQAVVSETPGSIYVPPDTVTLRTYSLDAEAAEVIREATDKLYGWVEPDLPQDLCFLRGSAPWLVNHAADEASCLVVSDDEAAAIEKAVPGLSLQKLPSRDIYQH